LYICPNLMKYVDFWNSQLLMEVWFHNYVVMSFHLIGVEFGSAVYFDFLKNVYCDGNLIYYLYDLDNSNTEYFSWLGKICGFFKIFHSVSKLDVTIKSLSKDTTWLNLFFDEMKSFDLLDFFIFVWIQIWP
jgi:hypothetical protein